MELLSLQFAQFVFCSLARSLSLSSSLLGSISIENGGDGDVVESEAVRDRLFASVKYCIVF